MATTEVHKYRVWCVTEGAYVFAWGESAPTTCPNNTGHSIDAATISIVETISAERNISKIDETELVALASASSLEETFTLDVAQGAASATMDLVFAWDIDILSAVKDADSSVGSGIDSRVFAYVMPPNQGAGLGVIGVVDMLSAQGQAVVSVDDTVVASVKSGYYVTLGSETKKYRIKSVATGQITLTENLTAAKNINDFVTLYVGVIIDRPMVDGREQRFGDKTFGGMGFPAGYVLRIEVTFSPSTLQAGEISFTLIYKY